VVTYKNEFDPSKFIPGTSKFSKSLVDNCLVYDYTSWVKGTDGSSLPPINYKETTLELALKDSIRYPGDDPLNPEDGKDNALYQLYEKPVDAIDTTNWLNDVNIYNTSFGEAQNRREVDVRDKFVKVRIRYSGEELAIIDYLNTIYRVSYV
jgi:hypothetical protein